MVRIPELVEKGRIARGEVFHAQIKIRHPNRTGLTMRDGRYVRESEPFHLRELDAFYGGERVSRFAMTSAMSDDPFITFGLRARREGRLEVVLVNTRGRRFEASQEIRFS